MSQKTEIAKLITSLLANYWLPDVSPAVRHAQAADWLEDLEEFPASVVRAACQAWRRSEHCRQRPLPGDIRALCRLELDRSQPRAAPVTLSPDAARALADRWAQAHDFLDIDDWQNQTLHGTRLVVGSGHHRTIFAARRPLGA